MRTYTTQMDAARQGIITPEMKEVAKRNTGQRKKSGTWWQKDRWPSAPTGFMPA